MAREVTGSSRQDTRLDVSAAPGCSMFGGVTTKAACDDSPESTDAVAQGPSDPCSCRCCKAALLRPSSSPDSDLSKDLPGTSEALQDEESLF